jgi:hypothetical protein
VSQATDPEQVRQYWRLVQQVEDAVPDAVALGSAASVVAAANLHDDDRAELMGLCDTYLADCDRLADPALDDPLAGLELSIRLPASAEDAADAEYDREDGFDPVEWPSDEEPPSGVAWG